MVAPPPRSPRAAPADVKARRVGALVAAASIEVLPQDELAGGALRGLLRPGTEVFVHHPPDVTHHDVVAACARLRRAGFVPVPHIAARHLASYTQADDFLRRAVGEAQIDGVLLVGGDAAQPVGPFHASIELLETGLFERMGLRWIGLPGYPEGHPLIAGRALGAALRGKIALSLQAGLAVEIVGQVSFEPQPVLDWIAALRADGVACPIRVGIAGPATVAALANVAVRCGIGAALRALAHDAAFARTQSEAVPDELIGALAAGETPARPIDRLHFYPFGGVRRTAEWVKSHSRPR